MEIGECADAFDMTFPPGKLSRQRTAINWSVQVKLREFLNDLEKVEDTDLKRWSRRVSAFIDSALGGMEQTNFSRTASGGKEAVLGYLEGLLALAGAEEALPNPMSLSSTNSQSEPVAESRSVFVVHGHDDGAKESVARFIEKVGLLPIILHEQPNLGRAIIEKFEVYSGDVAFAVVLLTPDDVGAAVSDQTNLQKRARQNVILELGYFMGKLGRNRVCALLKGGVDIPSDYHGVIYHEMDAAGAWRGKLAQELVHSKISINLTALLG